MKHLTMCYMLGLRDGGQAVGEHEYDRLCKEKFAGKKRRSWLGKFVQVQDLPARQET